MRMEVNERASFLDSPIVHKYAVMRRGFLDSGFRRNDGMIVRMIAKSAPFPSRVVITPILTFPLDGGRGY